MVRTAAAAIKPGASRQSNARGLGQRWVHRVGFIDKGMDGVIGKRNHSQCVLMCSSRQQLGLALERIEGDATNERRHRHAFFQPKRLEGVAGEPGAQAKAAKAQEKLDRVGRLG